LKNAPLPTLELITYVFFSWLIGITELCKIHLTLEATYQYRSWGDFCARLYTWVANFDASHVAKSIKIFRTYSNHCGAPVRVVPPLCLSPPVKGLEKAKSLAWKILISKNFTKEVQNFKV